MDQWTALLLKTPLFHRLDPTCFLQPCLHSDQVRQEEAGWCAQVLTHTIICMEVSVCVCWCVNQSLSADTVLLPVLLLLLLLTPSSGQWAPGPCRPMSTPAPGSGLVPDCSSGHMTARRRPSRWQRRWNCCRRCSRKAPMSTGRQGRREEGAWVGWFFMMVSSFSSQQLMETVFFFLRECFKDPVCS